MQFMRSDCATEFGDYFANRRILVTGATGFVGHHLCKLLLDLNADVYGTALDGRLHQELNRLPLTYIDFRDQNTLGSYIHNVRPDYVLHLASLVNTCQEIELVQPTLQHNLLGTINLMLSLAKTQVEKIVIVSSSETPAASEAPNSPYSASKEAITSYAKMFATLYKLPISIAKLFTCFGPFQRRNKLIPYIIESITRGVKPKLTNPEKVLDFIFVKDFVRGLLFTAKNDSAFGDTLDFGSGKGVQVEGMAKLIERLCNDQSSIDNQCYLPYNNRKGSLANIQETYNATGWAPVWTFEEALSETIFWFQNQDK
jgi:UDP-glucose 4-epimerase